MNSFEKLRLHTKRQQIFTLIARVDQLSGPLNFPIAPEYIDSINNAGEDELDRKISIWEQIVREHE